MRIPHERKQESDLFRAVLMLRDEEECRAFFEDICAITELRAIEQRFDVARMLHQQHVYTEIMEKTNASSATVSRVRRMLYSGRCIGDLLERLDAADAEAAREDGPEQA